MRVQSLTLALVLGTGCGRSGFAHAQLDADVDSGGTGSGASLLQASAPAYVGAPAISSALTLTGRSLLIAAVFSDKPGPTITLADTANLSWTVVDVRETTSCASRTTGIRMWYAAVDVPITTIVSATQGTSDSIGMFVAEYAGLDTANPIAGVTSLAAPAASNLMTTPPLVTSENTAIVAVFADALGGGMMAPGTGWNARAFDPTFYWMLVDDAPSAAPGTYTPSGTLPSGTSDACWVAMAAALRLR